MGFLESIKNLPNPRISVKYHAFNWPELEKSQVKNQKRGQNEGQIGGQFESNKINLNLQTAI
ncbi:hypothetical protein SAMN03080598_01211 [Algoriphagus boritolerans DSM 17298 = JCM 18970]|jgi:hypothetical protein|nr:hypothetical protein SAMN03080598_01211 [Algoriphagus boritolerans DSM 17298 = JCM 18970]